MTREEFTQAVQQLQREGRPVTRNAVLRVTGGGSKTHASRYVVEWQTAQHPPAPPVVPLKDVPPAPAPRRVAAPLGQYVWVRDTQAGTPVRMFSVDAAEALASGHYVYAGEKPI